MEYYWCRLSIRSIVSSRKIQQDVGYCIYFSTCCWSPCWLLLYKLCILQMEIPHQENFLREVIHIQPISIFIVLLPNYAPVHLLLSVSTAYCPSPSHHLSLASCPFYFSICPQSVHFHILPESCLNITTACFAFVFCFLFCFCSSGFPWPFKWNPNSLWWPNLCKMKLKFNI